MIIFSWLLSIALMTFIMIEALLFHKASVCRQDAWLKGTLLMTRTLLHSPASSEKLINPSCRLLVSRSDKEVHWQRLPSLKKHTFTLELKGKL